MSISEDILVCKSVLKIYLRSWLPEYFASTSRRSVNCRTSSDGIASMASG